MNANAEKKAFLQIIGSLSMYNVIIAKEASLQKKCQHDILSTFLPQLFMRTA